MYRLCNSLFTPTIPRPLSDPSIPLSTLFSETSSDLTPIQYSRVFTTSWKAGFHSNGRTFPHAKFSLLSPLYTSPSFIGWALSGDAIFVLSRTGSLFSAGNVAGASCRNKSVGRSSDMPNGWLYWKLFLGTSRRLECVCLEARAECLSSGTRIAILFPILFTIIPPSTSAVAELQMFGHVERIDRRPRRALELNVCYEKETCDDQEQGGRAHTGRQQEGRKELERSRREVVGRKMRRRRRRSASTCLLRVSVIWSSFVK